MLVALQNWSCCFLYINLCSCPVNISEELKAQAAILEKAHAELSSVQKQLEESKAEMETIKAVATVSEDTKQEAIDQVKQQWQEEVVSLQAIMKGNKILIVFMLKCLVTDTKNHIWCIVLFMLFETVTKSFISILKVTKLLSDKTNIALSNNKK